MGSQTNGLSSPTFCRVDQGEGEVHQSLRECTRGSFCRPKDYTTESQGSGSLGPLRPFFSFEGN